MPVDSDPPTLALARTISHLPSCFVLLLSVHLYPTGLAAERCTLPITVHKRLVHSTGEREAQGAESR